MRLMPPALTLLFGFGLLACTPVAHVRNADAGFRTDLDPRQPRPWTRQPFLNNPDEFQFAIVSDRTGGARPGIFDDAIRKLNLLRPEFVINVGDLIEGYSPDRSTIETQRGEVETAVGRLDMPFFFVPGNHDVEEEPSRTVWTERYGRTYYHFVYKNVLFLCLNDIAEGDGPAIPQAQIDYFAQVLHQNPHVRWTFLFLHVPLWVDPPSVQDQSGWARIQALVQDRPHTVFAGHYHTYMMYERNGQKYYRLATTGGASDAAAPEDGRLDQIVWVTMTDQGPRLATLDLKGIFDETLCTETSEKLRTAFGFYPSPLLSADPVFQNATTALTLTNRADLPAQVRVNLRAPRLLSVKPDRLEQNVPAHTSQTLTLSLTSALPIQASLLDPITLEGTARYEPSGSSPVEKTLRSAIRVLDARYFCPRTTQAVTVDGVLDEWADLPYVCNTREQVTYNGGQWKGPADASFRFGVQHDDRFVYLAIRVTDDVFASDLKDPHNVFYTYDGMNVSVDVASGTPPSTNGPRDVDTGLLRTWFTPGEPGRDMLMLPTNLKALPRGAKALCVRTPDGYALEMAIPIDYLERFQGTPWKGFQVNVQVVDADQTGTHTQRVLWWRPESSEGAGDCATSEAFVNR